MKLPPLHGVALVAAGLAVVAVAAYVWRKGGIAPAGAAIGAGAVQLVGGVASGAVGAVGASVGLPTPAETTIDAGEARYLIDRLGWFEASKWSGAPALFAAMRLDAGTGTPPHPSTPAGRMLAALEATAPPAARWWAEDVDTLLTPTPYTFNGA